MTNPIENISDTARWVAYYRALETQRPDALFKDPYALLLAGEKGRKIMEYIDRWSHGEWAIATRTAILDEVILSSIKKHPVETVLNLASGLDTRPYRLPLPPHLRWIEVDMPEIMTYKQEALQGNHPVCQLEQVKLDLSNIPLRQDFFKKINAQGGKILVITEGITVYLDLDANSLLARDLLNQKNFLLWATDIYSGFARLKFMTSLSRKLSAGNAPLRFFPPDGVRFYQELGWEKIQYQSYFAESARYRRPPPLGSFLQPMSRFLPKQFRKVLEMSAGILLLKRKD